MIVVKIGGSTLGRHDTSLDDIVALHKDGQRIVVVHGGGALISEWLDKHGIESRFVRGLRVTDEEALDVVVAVLAGVVNKHLVAALQSRGAKAVGIAGADGGILRARQFDEELGFVGEVAHVDPAALVEIVETGSVAVMAPIGIMGDAGATESQLLNVNADTAAGAVAAALEAECLIFLTDVPGVLDGDGELIESLSLDEAEQMVDAETVTGGMIPKLQSALVAASGGVTTLIADGREEGALMRLLNDPDAQATRIS